MGSKFLVVLAIALLAPFSVAQTYWVSPAGQGDWQGCSGAIPLDGAGACSILTANQNAVAGDIVYIRAGIYSSELSDMDFINPKNSGTAQSPITLSAYNGEKVTVKLQKAPDGDHEAGLWTAVNGAVASRSSEKVYEGAYSTKFTASAPGDGISSQAFPFNARFSGETYYFSAWIYSGQPKVNVYVRKGDGSGPAMDMDFNVMPNIWTKISKVLPMPGDFGYGKAIGGSNAYIMVRAPAGISSGTWFVDDVRLSPHGKAAIRLNNVDYIKVHGINAENTQYGLDIQNGASYNEISGSSFSNLNNGAYSPNIIRDYANSGKAPSTHNWIHHNTFRANGYVAPGGISDPADCDDITNPFRIGSGAPATDYSRYNLIEDNLFYHGGHDLIIISTSNNVLRNNVFHNEGWVANNMPNGCQDADGNPLSFNNPAKFGNRAILFENPSKDVNHNLVEGNRIGFAGTPPDDDGANGIETPVDGTIIRYNYIFANEGSAIYYKNQSGAPDDTHLYNNTMYRNGFGEYISWRGAILLACYDSGPPANNINMNNIIFNNATPPYRCTYMCETKVPGCMYSINKYYSNFEEDPLFVNPDLADPSSLSLPDLTLQPSSKAIDAGSELTKVAATDSGTGTTLKVEDAGFFQDGTWGAPGRVQADWIAIGTTSNVVQIASIDYMTDTITLASSLQRQSQDKIWLYKDSKGATVLFGAAPDIGAYEYSGGAQKLPQQPDDDLDGVPNTTDRCSKTAEAARAYVNIYGCAMPIAAKFDIRPDFSAVDINGLSNLELGISQYGKVSYANKNILLVKTTAQNEDERLNLDADLNISQGKITLNQNSLPQLNFPATITLYNINFTRPQIRKGTQACDACRIISYNKNTKTLVFSIPGF